MISHEHLEELNKQCAGEAKEYFEQQIQYVLLPSLRLPPGCTPNPVNALLCLGARDNYPTRLFFEKQISGKSGLNWNSSNVVILESNWFAYSWKDVTNDGRPLEVLLNHLKALA